MLFRADLKELMRRRRPSFSTDKYRFLSMYFPIKPTKKKYKNIQTTINKKDVNVKK